MLKTVFLIRDKNRVCPSSLGCAAFCLNWFYSLCHSESVSCKPPAFVKEKNLEYCLDTYEHLGFFFSLICLYIYLKI